MDYLIVIILLTFSALFSGLTLGLMGLNVDDLERKMKLGDERAKKVYPLRRRGNLLLTTLLVGNVAINAALSIFLGSIASGLVAGLIATTLIVIFGEIIPQAMFSRFALTLGAKSVWIVWVFLKVFYPIAAPIAWVLDKVLGEELRTIYSKQELMKIIEDHEDANESELDEDEERIIKGALTYSDKLVKDVMTPRAVLKTFEASQIVDKRLLDSLQGSGYSRIPIYKEKLDNVVGILYLTQLLGDKHLGKTVGEVADDQVYFVDENKHLDVVLNGFLSTHYHMFIVTNEFGDVMGLITLEDILEEIIRSEIVDEADMHPDMREVAREKARRRSIV